MARLLGIVFAVVAFAIGLFIGPMVLGFLTAILAPAASAIGVPLTVTAAEPFSGVAGLVLGLVMAYYGYKEGVSR